MVIVVPIFSASSRSWRDEDDGLLQPRLKLQKLVLQLGADQRIERGERLVHEQDRRLGGEGAGQADALLHAARQLMRVFLRPGRQIDEFELLADLLLALGLRHAGKFEAEADIFLHRAPRQQAELLEHHGDLVLAKPSQRRLVAGDDVDHLVAVLDHDAAARHEVQPVDGAQQRRFAGAGQAHQHGNLALVDGEVGARRSRARCRSFPGSRSGSRPCRSAPASRPGRRRRRCRRS